jgi:hypothetical protein
MSYRCSCRRHNSLIQHPETSLHTAEASSFVLFDCTRTNTQCTLSEQCLHIPVTAQALPGFCYSRRATLLCKQKFWYQTGRNIGALNRTTWHCVLRNLVVATNCFVWSSKLRTTELYRSLSSSRLLSSSPIVTCECCRGAKAVKTLTFDGRLPLHSYLHHWIHFRLLRGILRSCLYLYYVLYTIYKIEW